MKTFAIANARDLPHAVELARQAHADGQAVSFSGGGSDLLQQVKDGVVRPDVLVNLRSVTGLDQVTSSGDHIMIGGLITLDALSRHTQVRSQCRVLAEAAEAVATPQIRNVGTLAGNVCHRPWCWYYRNGFPCFKAGGSQCFSVAGENQLHAIFGGGPSYIVHPSDTAPALVALEARFRIVGPSGERTVSSPEFFILPRDSHANAPERENVLGDQDLLAAVEFPVPDPAVRSTYQKAMDRDAWTHALVSVAVVLEMDQEVCRAARIVLGGVAPIPWRVPEAENLLAGQRITPELARRAGEAAVAEAQPLSKNAYKVPLTKGLVERTVLNLATQA